MKRKHETYDKIRIKIWYMVIHMEDIKWCSLILYVSKMYSGIDEVNFWKKTNNKFAVVLPA